MKKLIAILTLFVFSLFVVYPQSKAQVTYVDTLKSVTVSVSTDVNKKVVDPAQTLFAESVSIQKDAQLATNKYLDTLTSLATSYIKDIEARNKNDSIPLMEKLGYDNLSVKKVLKTERWLDLLVLLLSLVYLLYVNTQLNKRDTAENLLIKGLLYIVIGIISAFLLRWTFVLVFNSGYFFMKELIVLYT